MRLQTIRERSNNDRRAGSKREERYENDSDIQENAFKILSTRIVHNDKKTQGPSHEVSVFCHTFHNDVFPEKKTLRQARIKWRDEFSTV